ncbi:unnamed protein product [Camellia sinensis]
MSKLQGNIYTYIQFIGFKTSLFDRLLSEMEIESTSIDTKNFQTQKESTITDSFDLFSGLFIHNKFAQQEERTCFLCSEQLVCLLKIMLYVDNFIREAKC